LTALRGGGASGQTDDGAVDRKIDEFFSVYNSATPGAAVAVVKDGKTVFKKGYGMANLEYDVPVTPKTVFNAASVSKQFTAFAVYLLEKQGKISFEDDIRKYLPEVPDFGKTVKIKHLLAHTSGLRDQWAILTLAGWRMDDVITTEHVLKMIGRQKRLNFEPGSAYSYSNSGYTLLAELVRRASGKTFAAYARENIFEPLGMTETRFYDDFEKIVKNRADSYESENGVYEKRNLNHSNVGATSLLTTVEDLGKWALNLEKPVVGDADLIKRFNQPSLLDNGQPVVLAVIDGETSYHAKGQFTRNYRGVNLLNHTGHIAGYRAYLVRFPDHLLSVVILGNDESLPAFKIGLEIAGLYLGNELGKRKIIPEAESRQTAESGSNKPFNPDLKDFAGDFYNGELATAYTVKEAAGKLYLRHSRLSDVELTETAKDKFSGKIEFPVEVEFVRNGGNSITAFKVSNFGAKNVLFEKINR
jgi:CubicO group peptidase (beta-lactamase class C family)